MPVLTIVLVLAAIGILVALVNKYGPPFIDTKFIYLINAVAIIAAIIWLMKVFGVWDYLAKMTV